MRRKKKGFSLVESLILILVMAAVVGAILQISAYTTRMQIAARQRIDAYLVAASWFAALESVDPASIDTYPDESFAIADAAVGNAAAYIVDKTTSLDGGVVIVAITLAESDNKKTVISRDYNIYGNDTVSDDKWVN